MAKVSDIMEKSAYTCNVNETIGDVLRHLSDVKVGGLPVVNDTGQLVGFITDGDILRYVARKKPKLFSWGDHIPVIIDEDSLEKKLEGLMAKPVMEVASARKLYVSADEDISVAAEILRREHVKKIAVLENDRVSGVLSRSAIIRHIAKMLLPEE
jgi:CBS domain-containing protein